AASASLAAAGAIASAILWRQRGGKEQNIHVDLRKAFVYQSPWQDVLQDGTLINGKSVMVPATFFWVQGLLPTRDNRFVLLGAPYPSQQAKAAQLFGFGREPVGLDGAQVGCRRPRGRGPGRRPAHDDGPHAGGVSGHRPVAVPRGHAVGPYREDRRERPR